MVAAKPIIGVRVVWGIPKNLRQVASVPNGVTRSLFEFAADKPGKVVFHFEDGRVEKWMIDATDPHVWRHGRLLELIIPITED